MVRIPIDKMPRTHKYGKRIILREERESVILLYTSIKCGTYWITAYKTKEVA